MTMKAVFLSDAHLKGPGDENFMALSRFLKSLSRRKMDELCIVGDLFDFWIGRNRFAALNYAEIISDLRSLRNAGCSIRYFEGNHDFFLSDYFVPELGCRVHEGPAELTYGGVRTYVTHGDEINTSDAGYRLLKAVLRNRLSRALSRVLPDRAVWSLGRSLSGNSRSGWYKVTDSARLFREFAAARFNEGCQAVIAAHSHAPALEQDSSGRVYANPGSWMSRYTYLEFGDGRFELKEFRD
jgi:UDP-2,3-diacylglucosamine hydrolase